MMPVRNTEPVVGTPFEKQALTLQDAAHRYERVRLMYTSYKKMIALREGNPRERRGARVALLAELTIIRTQTAGFMENLAKGEQFAEDLEEIERKVADLYAQANEAEAKNKGQHKFNFAEADRLRARAFELRVIGVLTLCEMTAQREGWLLNMDQPDRDLTEEYWNVLIQEDRKARMIAHHKSRLPDTAEFDVGLQQIDDEPGVKAEEDQEEEVDDGGAEPDPDE